MAPLLRHLLTDCSTTQYPRPYTVTVGIVTGESILHQGPELAPRMARSEQFLQGKPCDSGFMAEPAGNALPLQRTIVPVVGADALAEFTIARGAAGAFDPGVFIRMKRMSRQLTTDPVHGVREHHAV